MTKEHVPPKKAFNENPYLNNYATDIAETERLSWESKEENTGGIYVFSLCEECNNETGRRYGAEYIKFILPFVDLARPEKANQKLEVEFNDFYPLRVVKQVISMVLSTSLPTSFYQHKLIGSPIHRLKQTSGIKFNLPKTENLELIYESLRRFVQKRDLTGLPSNVKLYAFSSVHHAGFRTGIFFTKKISSNKVACAVATGLFPIHWVLVLDGDSDEELLDITDWANFEYKQRLTLKVDMPCYWLAGKSPLDFRNPVELYEDNFLNSMIFEGFKPELADKKSDIKNAVSFARLRGRWSREGFLMTEFKSGIYYEAYGSSGWLPDLPFEEARKSIKWRLEEDERLQNSVEDD